MAIKQSLKGLEEVSDEIAKLEKQFTKLEDFQKQAGNLTFKAVQAIIPLIQSCLAANYPDAKLKIISGDLFKAVSDEYVRRTKKGIVIALAPGFDTKVYIRAAVFKKYKGFFKLTDSQVESIGAAFTNEWKRLANQFFKGK